MTASVQIGNEPENAGAEQVLLPESLTFADGTVAAGHALESEDRLFFYLDNTTLADAWPLMSDPEKTARIIANSYGIVSEFAGYDHLYYLKEEGGGLVSGGLKKG